MSYEAIYKQKSADLAKELGIKNPMRLPRLSKIVVSSCVKDVTQDSKVLDKVAEEVGVITGQKPLITKAKKSIANFKLREGMSIGCKVTLRRKMMYEFLNRLVNLSMPRMRDFHGIPSKGFDGRGNYTLGVTEQIIFPEINFDKIDKVRGMNVTFVTTARTDQEAKALLKVLGMPFSA